MNKKKVSALVMAGLLACTFMAGCGNSNGDKSGDNAKQEPGNAGIRKIPGHPYGCFV